MALGLLVIACGRTEPVTPPPIAPIVVDAGAGTDAGPRDGGLDAGLFDAGPFDAGPFDAGAPDAGQERDAGFDAGPTIATFDVVYLHDSERLYTYAPPTGQLVQEARFSCRGVTDMAIDRLGRAFVVDFSSLYRVDVKTGQCLPIAPVPEPLVALTFLPAGLLDPTEEALVGYGAIGYWRFSPVDGAATQLGSSALMGGLEVSGDLTALSDGGTFLSVRDGFPGSSVPDLLVRIDARTGQVTQTLGRLTTDSVWGLATWEDELFGFSSRGQGLRISLSQQGTSSTVLALPVGFSFWGAAARPGAGARRDGGP